MTSRREHFDLGSGYKAEHTFSPLGESWQDKDDPSYIDIHGSGGVSIHHGDEKVASLEYDIRTPLRRGEVQKSERAIGGIERDTSPQHQRRGLQTHAQDIIMAAHPGVHVQSRVDDLSSDGQKFRATYMKRRGLTGKQWSLEDY